MNKITVLIEGILVLAMGSWSLVDGVRLNKLRGGTVQIDVLGPGNYNLGVGLILIIVGLAYVIVSYPREKLDGEKLEGKRESGKKIVIGIAFFLAVYIFLMNIIGFLLATMVFLVLMLRTLGFRSWLISAGLSITISVCIYIIFVYLLGMAFPQGVLCKY